jgi:hypothetical protein
MLGFRVGDEDLGFVRISPDTCHDFDVLQLMGPFCKRPVQIDHKRVKQAVMDSISGLDDLYRVIGRRQLFLVFH